MLFKRFVSCIFFLGKKKNYFGIYYNYFFFPFPIGVDFVVFALDRLDVGRAFDVFLDFGAPVELGFGFEVCVAWLRDDFEVELTFVLFFDGEELLDDFD
jgi:hypothetical protein